jgi:anti-sigma B factor antagonist
MNTRGPVIVMQLPERLNHAQAEAFLREFYPLLEIDRPRIVLDCSQVQHLDSAGVEMLLRCLEEAMKRDGDLKLAAVSPPSGVILELMRVDRLFEVFESAEQASRSFEMFASAAEPDLQPWYPDASGLGNLKAAG